MPQLLKSPSSHRITRRPKWSVAQLTLLVAWLPSVAEAQLAVGTRITVLLADEALGNETLVDEALADEDREPRLEMVHDAISFWNTTFKELGLETLLIEPQVMVNPPSLRVIENYARMISQRVGRLRPGSFGPPPPEELTEIDADVIILLSRQKLMPFSWPLKESNRTFIAITAPPVGKPVSYGGLRNIIAHELGHALGLVHNNNPDVLMCMPCRGGDASKTPPGAPFSPLTEKDRLRLRELYATRGLALP